jgi:hypothetical protein
MKNLETYIERQNVWRGYANLPLFDINNLSAYDVTELSSSLSSDLSPENLHCDGEITITQARAKYAFYVKVAKELNKTGHHAVISNL